MAARRQKETDERGPHAPASHSTIGETWPVYARKPTATVRRLRHMQLFPLHTAGPPLLG